jgi:hypothetical protein
MLRVEKIIAFICTLLLTTISLAITCAPDDADCVLAQKKEQMMKESGIEPIATKDQPVPDANANKKSPEYVPFQIPKPGSQTDTDQDTVNQSESVQYNPGLKLFSPEKQSSQGQTATPQTPAQSPGPKPLIVQPIVPPTVQPIGEPSPQPQNQAQTSIYR